MGLIPHAESSKLARQAIVLDLGDLERQAEWVRTQAEEAAARFVEDAKKERERILAGAHDEGFAEGRAEGVEQGRVEGAEAGRKEAFEAQAAELGAVQEAWAKELSVFLDLRDGLLAGAREDLLRLSISIAERILRRSIEADPSIVVDQVRAALELTLEPTRLIIEVNAEDRSLVEVALPELTRHLGGSAHAQLTDADDLERGACRVRTDRGVIDGDINTQVEQIVRTLLPEADE
ncbi:MAG: FliH/SctL family protein [Phycisphaerales bacterium]